MATSSVALRTSVTTQKMMASTSTGTVSLVSVCSARNCVVRMRVSTQAAMMSRMGMMTKRPGPLMPVNLPARRITTFSHCCAILSAARTRTPRMMRVAPRAMGRPVTIERAPTPANTTKSANEIGLGPMMRPLRLGVAQGGDRVAERRWTSTRMPDGAFRRRGESEPPRLAPSRPLPYRPRPVRTRSSAG